MCIGINNTVPVLLLAFMHRPSCSYQCGRPYVRRHVLRIGFTVKPSQSWLYVRFGVCEVNCASTVAGPWGSGGAVLLPAQQREGFVAGHAHDAQTCKVYLSAAALMVLQML